LKLKSKDDKFDLEIKLTSLRKRLENVLTEISIIRDALRESGPPCCLKFFGKMISCDWIGPLEEKEFLRECKKCREEIKRIIEKWEVR
jgi:hypothetical protein